MIRPVSFGAATPHFGMTAEQQQEVRQKVFDTLYPHLDQALWYLNEDFQRQPSGAPNILTTASQAIVGNLTQLAGQPPNGPGGRFNTML